MRVLVCGGRDYQDIGKVYQVLTGLLNAGLDIEFIITGAASGADTLAERWAQTFCVPCLSAPANWKRHGRNAGHIRNAQMLRFKPDLVIAFPGGPGTANMIKLATEAGVPVQEIQ